MTGYKNSDTELGNQNAPKFDITNICITDNRYHNISGSNTSISIAQLLDFVKSRFIENYNNDYKEVIAAR